MIDLRSFACAAIAFAALACRSPEPTPPRPCFEISAEAPGARRAELSVTFSGEEANLGTARCVRVAAGEVHAQRALGASLPVFDIPADLTALTRLRIGGQEVLLFVAPGARVLISDDLCFGWRIVTPRLAGEAPARLRLEAGAWKGPLTLRSAMQDEADPGRPVRTSSVTLAAGGCGFDSLSTGVDTVLLAVAAGASWTLQVDAQGRISGRRE